MGHKVLTITIVSSLDVVEVIAIGIKDYLGRVVEENSIRSVTKFVTHPILGGEVHVLDNQLR